jgi:hypothetical protein
MAGLFSSEEIDSAELVCAEFAAVEEGRSVLRLGAIFGGRLSGFFNIIGDLL